MSSGLGCRDLQGEERPQVGFCFLAEGKQDLYSGKKEEKTQPDFPRVVAGILDGVTIYIMHCKSDVGEIRRAYQSSHRAEVRALVEKEGLGQRLSC